MGIKNVNSSNEFIKVKHRGKIYTPDYLVEDILNQGHYIEGNINKKHVIDNSCGDGQFMIHVVDRYCKDFLKTGKSAKELKKQLEKYIHAIDIENDELETCISRCEKVANMYEVFDVKWDFINADTLNTNLYDKKMDFVVGNPPYVRVHNLDENLSSVKSFLFGNGGMTDLYIAFYEKGIQMLNKTGILCYITPSSFFTSLAGLNMRKYLFNYNWLESICDLKHFQPFKAITYTTIVCINKNIKNDTVLYYEFDEKKLIQKYVDTLSSSEYLINDNFYFNKKRNLKLLRKIICNTKSSDVAIKNGYATLADKVFIGDFSFKSKFIIPVLKASKAQWTKIIFPYDKNSKIVSENVLKKDKKIYDYLVSKKEELVDRSNENDNELYWYAFGRSQAISDTFKDKISINALIRNSNDLKIIDVPSGSGVYSGLYITSDTIDTQEIKKALESKEFGEYISLLGKYKSGGYYTFSSKDVKRYLDYKLGKGGFANA